MIKEEQSLPNSNPIQMNGFDFIEFATRVPNEIIAIFTKLGFVLTGRHQRKNIFLLKQGNIKFIVNAEINTDAAVFESVHGSSVCGISFRVKDSCFALEEAVKRGAKAVICADYGLPAIEGVGGSKIYLVDRQTSQQFLASFFTPTGAMPLVQPQVTYIDHVTQNVFKGNMDSWAKFYERVFNFREIRFFDIKGKQTGLRSKALGSPCGKVRMPLNESQDDLSQIAEFLQKYNGEGIQHIALGCRDIYAAVTQIQIRGIVFQDTPDSYYELINRRIANHQENISALRNLKILIDGGNEEEGILLQIFTKEIVGPIFFELIERKGNKGFGEGNFQALFESIELDQFRRGVLKELARDFEQTAKPEFSHPMYEGKSTKTRAKSPVIV